MFINLTDILTEVLDKCVETIRETAFLTEEQKSRLLEDIYNKSEEERSCDKALDVNVYTSAEEGRAPHVTVSVEGTVSLEPGDKIQTFDMWDDIFDEYIC